MSNFIIADCTEGKKLGYISSGQFPIQPFRYDKPILVLCELQSGRTFFHYKKNSAGDFFRNWAAYRDGFGAPGLEDFWLGNENIYQVLKQGTYTMTVFTSTVTTDHYHGSQYSDFRLGSEPEGYPMLFERFLNAGFSVFDVFCSLNTSISLNGTVFSTYDHGDQSLMANASRSGWWFNPLCFWDFNGILGETQLLYEGQMETLYEVYAWIENTEYYVE